MGLIEKYKQFKKNRLERAVAKNLKTIQNPKAIREDRAAAIDFFKELEDANVAVPSLLKRFDFSLEHGINDTREKESAMEGVLSFKEKALPFVQEHLIRTTRIAWPIKILEALASSETTVSALEACLDYGDVSFDQVRIDKNYDILCYLRDHDLHDKGKKLLHFAKDADERVRFASVEAILKQQDPAVIKELEYCLVDDSSENTRIRQSLIDAYLEHKWTIQNKDSVPTGILCPGVRVNLSHRLESV